MAAPVLAGTLLDGRAFDLSTWTGRTVVINVWGSWCPPCRQEQPALVTAAAELAPTGVEFLGLDQRHTPANGLAHNRHHAVTHPACPTPPAGGCSASAGPGRPGRARP